MDWPDEDDLFEGRKSKKIHRKPRKSDNRHDDNTGPDELENGDYKRKRAGKRSHRPRISNDEFWERNQ